MRLNADEVKYKMEVLALRRYGRLFLVCLAALLVVLLVIEVLAVRHGEFAFEDLPFFPAAFGFGGFVLMVALGWGCRRYLARSARYYSDEERDDDV